MVTILTAFQASTEMRSPLSLLCLSDCIAKIFKKKLKAYFGLVKQSSIAGIDSKAKVSCICKSLNYCRVPVNFKTRDCSSWGGRLPYSQLSKEDKE